MSNRALIAVKNTQGITGLCRRMKKLGWSFIGTRNVVNDFSKEDIDIQDVADFVGLKQDFGIPPTLHPRIEQALTQDGASCIDLVFDVPYSLADGHDIGGRTLLGLAAKGNRWAICSENDFRELIEALEKPSNDLQALRNKFTAKALAEIARYYSLFAGSYTSEYELMHGERKARCLEGENPYQQPCDLFTLDENDPLGCGVFKQLFGQAPSFTTLADMDNIVEILEKMKSAFYCQYQKHPFITVAAKHGNPCGIGIDWDDPRQAVGKALWGNPMSIWGGEVVCNFDIDACLAKLFIEDKQRKELYQSAFWMLDLILAPKFTKQALALLGKRDQRVLMVNPALREKVNYERSWSYRFLRSGYLRQPHADYILDIKQLEWVNPAPESKEDLIIAWAASYNSFLGGNEVAIAGDGMLRGIGGGPSTFMAVRHAVDATVLAHHDIKDASFCADAFFPFTDAPKILADNGCVSGIVAAGGRNHDLVKRFFKERSISCGFIPHVYRGFCRH